METQFLERIQWSKRTYALRMLLEFRHPPCIVHIPEGYRGNNEIENLQPGLVARIQSVFTERRVFARSVDGRVFSIPETFPIKFEVVKKSGKKRKAKRLDEILRNYRPPILVALDRKNSKWNFRNGRMIQSEDSLGTLILFKAYFEHFARANQLINGVIDRRIFLIPLYLDLDVRLAEGYRNRSRSDFDILMRMLEAAVQSLEYNSYTGLNAILVFDPSVGSVHPLASSRIHSRTNSAPGGGENSVPRTPTDEQTTATAKSSLPTTSAAGSQYRKRAKSEDFLLGSILLERRSNGRTPAEVDSKAGSSNSSSGDVNDDVVPAESNPGSRSLNRRKGRSAEELQGRRSVHGSSDVVVLTKSTSGSLDPLGGGGGGDAQARRQRRNRKERKRISASVDQLNYIRNRTTDDVRADDVRIDDVRARLRSSDDADRDGRSGRPEQTVQGQVHQGQGHQGQGHQGQGHQGQGHQGQGQARDEVFDEDDVSASSAESVSASPLPRSKGSRSRKRSEDNHIPEPRTNKRSEDSYVPEPLHSKRTQVPETNKVDDPDHRIQNTAQATPASPLPNYHIHINIQSPQSPPTELWPGHSRDLSVHSLVRGSNAAVQPISRSPPPTGFKDAYGGPGTLQMGSLARGPHRGDGMGAPIVVRSDQNHGRPERFQAYSMGGGGTLPTRHANLHTLRDRGNSSRAFVSSVSCPGPPGFSYQDPVKGQWSNRLSSKVIRLDYPREPTIRDREIGNSSRYDPNNHHHHRRIVALPDVFDTNNNNYYHSNFNVGSSGINAKYQHNGQARSVTNIEIPAPRREKSQNNMRASALSEDQEILRSQRAAVEQRMGRRWVIKNYNNQPPVKDPSGVRHSRLAATIAVE